MSTKPPRGRRAVREDLEEFAAELENKRQAGDPIPTMPAALVTEIRSILREPGGTRVTIATIDRWLMALDREEVPEPRRFMTSWSEGTDIDD